jgi:alanine racemase
VKNALKRLVYANPNHNCLALNAGMHRVGVNQDRK